MNVSVIVGEAGADWADEALRLRTPSNEFTVLVQLPEESNAEFRERVTRRLGRIGLGNTLRQIVFLPGSRHDRDALLAREQLLAVLRRKALTSDTEPAVEYGARTNARARAAADLPARQSGYVGARGFSLPAPIRV